MLPFIAILCAGVFAGAALYISIAQHPAALQTGADFAARFFAPMYRRAAPMQIALAICGALAGCGCWLQDGDWRWLIGALLLFSVIPFTLLAIKPINDVLLSADRDADANDTLALLRKWGTRHCWRSALGSLAFVLFVLAD